MQLIYLTANETIFINILSWLIIHLMSAAVGKFMPIAYLCADNIIYRPKSWELKGNLYKKIFKVHKWKHLLPDAGSWFKNGFAKRKLKSRKYDYLNDFIRETCRAEIIHWFGILPVGLFFIWNVWWVGLIMIAYSLTVNLPCIITQRYNRIRFLRLASQKSYPRGIS